MSGKEKERRSMLGSTACYLLDTTFLGADGKILNSAEVQK